MRYIDVYEPPMTTDADSDDEEAERYHTADDDEDADNPETWEGNWE